jgi:hypothetical protein
MTAAKRAGCMRMSVLKPNAKVNRRRRPKGRRVPTLANKMAKPWPVLASALNDQLGTALPDLNAKLADRDFGTRSFLNEAPVCWCSWFALQCPWRNAQCQALYRRTSLPPSDLLAQSDVLARRQTVAANAATVGCSSGGFATARNLALTAEGRTASLVNA